MVCLLHERSLRLLRLASEPWDVLRRHVWPRSFRDSVAAVADVTRGRGDKAICFTILSFCGRGWWAGLAGEARASAPRSAAEVLRRLVCDECQLCPMVRAGLKRCAGCRAVYYCTRVDAGGRAACQLEAWGGHKAACKAAVRERKRLEEVV